MKLGCGRGRQVLSGWRASGPGRSRGDGRRALALGWLGADARRNLGCSNNNNVKLLEW